MTSAASLGQMEVPPSPPEPGQPIRVLLVQGEASGRNPLLPMIEGSTRPPLKASTVSRLSQALDQLDRRECDLLVLDLDLPDSRGIETLLQIRVAHPEAPVIVILHPAQERLEGRALQEGAHDCLLRTEITQPLLLKSIRYCHERHQVEEALAKERDLLHALLDNIPDRIYFKDRESRFLRCSRAVAQTFKLAHPKQAVGKTDADFFTSEHAQSAYNDEQQIMRTGQPLIGILEKETMYDGRVHWVSTTKMPLRDRQGRVVGTFGLSHDITTIKQMEETLAMERNLLRNLIDNLPDYIYVKDTESRLLLVNRELMHDLGATRMDEVAGKKDFDFFPPEIAQKFYEDDQAIMRSGQALINREEPMTGATGTEKWVITSKVPLRDIHGNVTGLVGITRDITSRKQAEEALAKERNLLRTLIDNAPDYIYIKDTEARFLISNVAHIRALGGQNLADIVGKTDFDCLPHDQAEKYFADDMMVMQSGEPLHERVEFVEDTSRGKRWVLTFKIPLRDPSNKVIGLVGISRDITELKTAEEKLRDLNEDLARKQQELLQALQQLQHSHGELKNAQMQLIQAEKMESVGRLAAGVAHEVKNPLAIVKMGLNYLSKAPGEKDENTSMVLKDMNEAVQKADFIIRGLLDFSASRELQLHKEDLNSVIIQSLRLVKHAISEAAVDVSQDLGTDLPHVQIDRNRIEQVFVNLFINACHAMPKGGCLTVRTYSRQLTEGDVGHDAGDRIFERMRVGEMVAVTEVEDTGIGIPEAKLSKVFDPFFTTKPTGTGTGLGLAVTRKIIELHNGAIQIQNRKEGGVRVTLVFKL